MLTIVLDDIILATFILVLEAHFLVRWSILARLTRISRHTCCDQSSKLLYGVFLLWAFSLLITNRNQRNISRALSHMVERVRVSEWERKREREREREGSWSNRWCSFRNSSTFINGKVLSKSTCQIVIQYFEY